MPMLQELTGVGSSIAQAAAGRMTNLPVMSSAELCALNALTHPVLDQSTLAWWNSQEDQKNLTQMAYSELVRRQLFDPATRQASAPLDLILSARANPAFIVVTRNKPDAEPRPDRLYGAADDLGKRAVLVEQVKPSPGSWSGPAYSYQPTRIQAQADALTDWVTDRKGRTIDFYLPGTGIVTRPVERFTVTSPATRDDKVTFYRESFKWTATFNLSDLTSLIVGIMAGIPYFPNRLPIKY